MKFSIITFLSALLVCSNLSHAAISEFTNGHGDIGLAIEAGSPHAHVHVHTGGTVDGNTITDLDGAEFDAPDIAIRVGDATQFAAPIDLSFLGITAGQNVWVLPGSGSQASSLNVPFLGLAGEALDGYSSLQFQLTSFSGPGQFALYQSDGFGFTPFMSTNDGLSGSDVFTLGLSAGAGHDHANWAFTQTGVYDLGLTLTATGGAGTISDTASFRFVVGSATAVPEPTSMLLLAGSATIFAVRRARRAKRQS